MAYDYTTPYTGDINQTIAIKQQQLSMYLQAQQAFASGAQSYKIGTRELTRVDMQQLQDIIDALMKEIVNLQNRGKRRGVGVILRDI